MTELSPELVEKVARAISVPQHHTTWDTLSDAEKDLFYMQADYAIHALNASTLVDENAMLRDEAIINRLHRMKHKTMPKGHWDALNIVIEMLEARTALSHKETNR